VPGGKEVSTLEKTPCLSQCTHVEGAESSKQGVTSHRPRRIVVRFHILFGARPRGMLYCPVMLQCIVRFVIVGTISSQGVLSLGR
jgi:hypothetical protein